MTAFKPVDGYDLAYFRELMPLRVLSGDAISDDFDHDEMPEYGHYRPEALLYPLTTEEVSAALAYCNRNRIAVTPRGAGTGLCGGCVPHLGGVVLCTDRMKRVLEVDVPNMTATVEPGVLLIDFP